VLVECGIFFHDAVHVGNTDQKPYRTVRQLLGEFDLVEIFRLGVIDGAPEERAEIASVWRCRGGVNYGELGLRRRVELRGKAIVV